MSNIATELLSFITRDHERGCAGREYVCSCGYDAELEAAVKRAAEEIVRLTAALTETRVERDAAMETMREVATHTARFMTAVGGIYAAINMDLEKADE